MLKYRINKKEVINNSNIITVENVEDYRTTEEEKKTEITSVDDTFICTFTCKSINSLNANKDAKNKIYTVHNFSAIDDEGTEYPCNYTYEYEVDGSVVNDEKNTFSLELSKLFLLPTVSIGRVATYPNDVDIEEPIYYMYIYFQNSHLFNRYNSNGDEMKIKLYFNCYTNNSIEFFYLEMEYVTPFVVRYKWDDENENLKALFEEDDKGNINPNGNIYNVEIYRENPLFGVYDNYIIYNNSPVCSINLPLGIKFRTDLQKEQLMADYLTDRRKKSINRITDMEKDVYHPVQWDNEKNEKKNDIYQIIFNLHFREHRYDDWNAAPDSYWNGVIFDANDNKLKLMNGSEQEELGYFSYNKDDWDRSNQSDLLCYLNFTNEDIRYQKSKLKKSFLRLLFFDSMNPADQNLLAYSTVFIDSGALFSKYVRHFEGEGFSALNYNGDIVLPTSLDLNGIRINREPMIGKETYKEFKDKLEDVRLSSQLVIKDRYNSTSSSEGFYLYLWRDNDNGIIPSDLYMKVEFNHAGYGRTIPFMMPYEDKDGDNKGKIKTFKEIVEDWSPIKNENENEDKNKDKYVGYGIKRYLKYSYIHLKYQYDTVDKRHVYYVDTDLYKGTDKSIYGIDNTMKFDLYEAKINFDSEIIVNDEGTSIDYNFEVTDENNIKVKNITFGQSGGEMTVNVTSYQNKNGQRKNLKFVVNENGLNWCKWEQNGNKITITAEENNYNSKQGTLILIQEKSNKQISIDISQEEKVISTKFVAEPPSFDVEDKGGTCEVNVISEYDNGEEIDYTINITSADNAKVEWITNINQTSGGFTFDVKANEEATARDASIKLTQLTEIKKITVNQEGQRIYTFELNDKLVNNNTLTVDNKGGVYEVGVISKDSKNTPIHFTASADTNNVVNNIEIIEVTNGKVGEFILEITCEEADSLSELQDNITLIQEDSEEELTLNVIQEPMVNYFYFKDNPSDKEINKKITYNGINKEYKIVSKNSMGNYLEFWDDLSDYYNFIGNVDLKDGYKLTIEYPVVDGKVTIEHTVVDDKVIIAYPIVDSKVTINGKEEYTVVDKVTFDNKEYTVEDGKVTIDGVEYTVVNGKVIIAYPIVDSKVTIDGNPYPVENGKVTVEYVVEDNKVTIDGKKYTVVDGKVAIDYSVENGKVIVGGAEYTIEDDKVTIGENEYIVKKGDYKLLSFTVMQNNNTTAREASITLTQETDDNESKLIINILQDGNEVII